MNKLYKQKELYIALFAMIFLCLFILSTHPQKLSAGFLLVPPVLLFIVLSVFTYAALQAFVDMPKARRRLVASVVATAPVLLLLLGSLGQLTSKDTLLSLLFVGGMAAYFSRAALGHKT